MAMRPPAPILLFPASGPSTPRRVRFGERDLEIQPAPAPQPLDLEETSLLSISVQAYAEGFARGHDDAYDAESRRLQSASDSLSHAVDALSHVREEALAGLDAEVLKLALAVAERVIAEEIEAGKPIALRLVRSGLARLGECARVVVRMNPADVASLGDEPLREGAQVIADPAISRGGAVFESEFGRLDARLEVQLDEIRRALREGSES